MGPSNAAHRLHRSNASISISLKRANQAGNPTNVVTYDRIPLMLFAILNDKQCLVTLVRTREGESPRGNEKFLRNEEKFDF